MRTSGTVRIHVALVATFLICSGAHVAQACVTPVIAPPNEPPPPPPPPPIWFQWYAHEQQGDTLNIWRGWVRVHNYFTFGAGPGQRCGCGLNLNVPPALLEYNVVSPTLTIEQVAIVEAETFNPIVGFANFQSNSNTSAGFGESYPEGTWFGFDSSVQSVIPAGIKVDLLFWLKLTERKKPAGFFAQQSIDQEVVAALENGRVGSDEVDASGTPTGHHQYILKPLHVMVQDVGDATPPRFQMAGPRPNPMVSSTTIGFTLPSAEQVSVEVFDLAGRRVRALVSGVPYPAGVHSVAWNGQGDSGQRLPSGMYIIRLSVAGRAQGQRVILLQ